VLVVDDDPAVRRGVSRLARAAGYATRTFASPVEFLGQELPHGPACLVLDMCMDGMTGLDVQNALTRNTRRIPIVFLSGHGTVPVVTAGIKRGAEDFLEKPVRPKQLLAAIAGAVDQDRSQALNRAKQRALLDRYESLTTREREVMSLVVGGLLNKQAAADLGISEKTIKVHRARVMEKMQVDSLAALVQLAGQLELNAPPPPTTT
jgi:FixJ family two-component response regulator